MVAVRRTARFRTERRDVLACLPPMLRAAGPGSGAPLEELARDCERRLTAITGRPARADDDWPVPRSGGCSCEPCGTLGGFLVGRSERTLEWPLAEARRKHVKDQISATELPVRHETWKFGSPHTLVLTKTDELFRREAEAALARVPWPTSADLVRPAPPSQPGPGTQDPASARAGSVDASGDAC